MSEYKEWTQALEVALAEPFPPEWVSDLEKKNKKTGAVAHIPYVSWHWYAHRLNELVGPGWSMGEPVIREVGGKLVVGLPISIFGVTRINFGDEEEGKDDFGTASTNAWAQAFKRTCALFGMGLYMYDKGARARTNGSGGPAASAKQVSLINKLLQSHWISDEDRAKIEAAVAAGMSKSRASDAIDYLQEQIDIGKQAEKDAEVPA